MKSGWLNLDLLEFLSALSFLVFLFIKYEEIPAIFLEKNSRFGTFHGEIFFLKEKKNVKPQRI